MFEGMNMSMLPGVMANTGFSAQVPQNLQMAPTPAASQEWYNNPGFWSMIGKFGAAISPKDSWGRDLGLAAAGEGQARQYGAGMNKMIGPMLAGTDTTPTQLGTVAPTPAPTTGGVSSAVPPTPGVAPGSYPGVGPVVNPVQNAVNPFNDVPFSGGPSAPVLSNMEMMGLSPDQIKDVFGAAVEAKKFPIEIDRVRAGTEYTRELTRHTKAATDEAAKQAKIKQDLDTSWNTYIDKAIDPESDVKLPKGIDISYAPILKGLGREKAATIIDNLINLQKETKKAYNIHYEPKTGKAYAVNPQNPADRMEWDTEKTPDGAEKLPSAGYVNFAYNRALSNALPALEEHYVKTLGDKAKARAKMVQIQAMLGKDPNLAAGEIQALIASAPAPLRDKIVTDYNTTLNSMVANQGQILPGERPQGPQSQGAEASPGILGYRKPVPEKNQFMLEGLDKTEPTPFDDTLNQHFSPKDMSMAKLAMKRESSGNPRARNVNKNGTVDYGLFQINEVNVPELRKAGIIQDTTDLYDIDVNIKAASYLQKKYGWKPWKSSLGDLAEGKTASDKQATGWKGAGYYSVNGKKTAIRSEEEYRSITGG